MPNAATVSRTATKPQIPCFGLHLGKNNVPYLFQDHNPNGYDFRGKSTKSGLFSNEISGTCPHALNIYMRSRSVPKRHAKAFKAIVKDPLVQAMAPVPSEYKAQKIYQFEQDNLLLPCLWLRTLERMSSPLYSHVLNVQSITRAYVFKAIQATNIHPLVIYGITELQKKLVESIAAEARKNSRTVIFIGEPVLKNVPVTKSTLSDRIMLNDLVLLPMEHIGVRLLDNLVSNKELPW